MIEHLNPKLSIYYNFDDYQDNWPKYKNKIPKWENEAIKLSDLTICIANYRSQKIRLNVLSRDKSIFHLPIGCTPKFMSSQPCEPKPEIIPLRLKNISSPCIGYVGALDRRFDYQFLVEVAKQLPNIQFILGGDPPSVTEKLFEKIVVA